MTGAKTMPTDQRPGPSLDARVARTEANLEQLSSQVLEIAKEQRQGFTDMRTEMRDSRAEQVRMHSENLSRGQSKLGNFAAWAGIGIVVLLAIAGGWSSGYIRDQDRHERIIDKLIVMAETGLSVDAKSETIRDRLRSDVDGLTSTIPQRYKELDDKLQRETGLMNAATEKAVDALGRRIDGEIMWLKTTINDLDRKSGGSGSMTPHGPTSDSFDTRNR